MARSTYCDFEAGKCALHTKDYSNVHCYDTVLYCNSVCLLPVQRGRAHGMSCSCHCQLSGVVDVHVVDVHVVEILLQ